MMTKWYSVFYLAGPVRSGWRSRGSWRDRSKGYSLHAQEYQLL